MSKQFDRLTLQIDNLLRNERFGSENRDKIAKALKKLSHALDIKNIKKARKAIDELSKELL
jgi:hypothetical protein